MFTDVYIYICIHVYIYIYTYVHVYICIYIYMYVYAPLISSFFLPPALPRHSKGCWLARGRAGQGFPLLATGRFLSFVA